MAAGLPDAASKVVVSTAWAPLPYWKIIDVVASTPVNPGWLTAVIRAGTPSTRLANETGYTPRSSRAPPPSSGANSRNCGSGADHYRSGEHKPELPSPCT